MLMTLLVTAGHRFLAVAAGMSSAEITDPRSIPCISREMESVSFCVIPSTTLSMMTVKGYLNDAVPVSRTKCVSGSGRILSAEHGVGAGLLLHKHDVAVIAAMSIATPHDHRALECMFIGSSGRANVCETTKRELTARGGRRSVDPTPL